MDVHRSSDVGCGRGVAAYSCTPKPRRQPGHDAPPGPAEGEPGTRARLLPDLFGPRARPVALATCLFLSILAGACTSEPAPGEVVLGAGPDVLAITGRWVGTSSAGESVDVELTEIVHDVGGLGTVVRGGEVIEVAVSGRHEGSEVTLRFSASGEGWNFRGNADQNAREIGGAWTTFTGTFALRLAKCIPGADRC